MNYEYTYDFNPLKYIGNEEGLTPYSDFPLQWIQSQQSIRPTLSASEYYAVTQGYLREWVCMAQCNMYIQIAQDPFIKKAIEIYRQDVCEPNLTELMVILKNGGYKLPAEYNAISASKSIQELGNIQTGVINDQQIFIGFIFSTMGFMNLWNMGAAHSFRTEVRNAFVRNYHRANRWHLAFHAMGEQMGFIQPQPEIQPR
ncbi:hypothetical protein [Terrihalobacillus insolitus]|uniref:hypothetical protein n=1 Tax=Terrihalobacillus insolitus TaxID=2950438 RepID=UPI00233F9C3F|nr:hypothetical protein [Terrihalobacillus insolitus]MDC3415199.1 hypothetical protein [Terrihalobacillus insolitus]